MDCQHWLLLFSHIDFCCSPMCTYRLICIYTYCNLDTHTHTYVTLACYYIYNLYSHGCILRIHILITYMLFLEARDLFLYIQVHRASMRYTPERCHSQNQTCWWDTSAMGPPGFHEIPNLHRLTERETMARHCGIHLWAAVKFFFSSSWKDTEHFLAIVLQRRLTIDWDLDGASMSHIAGGTSCVQINFDNEIVMEMTQSVTLLAI